MEAKYQTHQKTLILLYFPKRKLLVETLKTKPS